MASNGRLRTRSMEGVASISGVRTADESAVGSIFLPPVSHLPSFSGAEPAIRAGPRDSPSPIALVEDAKENFQKGVKFAEHLFSAILKQGQNVKGKAFEQLDKALLEVHAPHLLRSAGSGGHETGMGREKRFDREEGRRRRRKQVGLESNQSLFTREQGSLQFFSKSVAMSNQRHLKNSCFASVSLSGFASITASTLTPPTPEGASSTVVQAGASDRAGADEEDPTVDRPMISQFLKHPTALIALVPKSTAMFLAGAVSGALAKTTTAPLDRVKLMMQVRGVQDAGKTAGLGLIDAVVKIGKEEGVAGYWKGNLPQVLRVVPYSAVQLFVYDYYKRLFQGTKRELSVPARLAAGACAGMTSTLVTYPLDVLRLRLAVDPACKSMSQVALNMVREEGLGAFYRGLGPSLLGIAPYIAINFCAFDLIKKAMPDEVRQSSLASFLPAFLSAALASTSCYPLDTVRRQMQMRGTPYRTVLDAFPGVIAKEGVIGLYRGFVANALKNLPNSSIRLGTYDAAKSLINVSKAEYDKLVAERRTERIACKEAGQGSSSSSRLAIPSADP